MATIRYYSGGKFHELQVSFKLDRKLGRWNLHRADNSRFLGWITQPTQYVTLPNVDWTAHVSACAFRGENADDEGHVLDRVPGWLFNGDESQCTSRTIVTTDTRQAAAEAIVDLLVRKEAPALGFGRNPYVKRWADR